MIETLLGAATVGFCMGAVGVGGVLLIPALAYLGGLGMHEASATALFTFIFSSLYGTWLYHRRGSLDWKIAIPLCAGALVFSAIGAIFAAKIDATMIGRIVALFTLAAGLLAMLPVRSLVGKEKQNTKYRNDNLTLFLIGSFSGFCSGLSGAGGPLFSVPIMLASGFAPLVAVSVDQVLQIVSATSGSLVNIFNESIHFEHVTALVLCELAGVHLGVHFSHRAGTVHLRLLVVVFCLLIGSLMFIRFH